MGVAVSSAALRICSSSFCCTCSLFLDMADLSAPRLLLLSSMIVCLAKSEPSAAPPQCSYSVRAIRFGFQFEMTSFPTGRYTISVGEEGSPTTDKIIYISSSNKNPTHEIQRLKPCTEYEHKVTLLDNNGTEIFCSGSGGKAKTLNMNEQDITNSPCIPGYVCYQSGWNIRSSVSAPNQTEQLRDGNFGFKLAEDDICSNFTVSFYCNNSSFNLTRYIPADYINPNETTQTKHNRLPAQIETKLPPNCKNLSIEYTYSESGKVGGSIQLSDLEPFTDYSCTGLMKNNNVSINKITPAVQLNITCDFTTTLNNAYENQSLTVGWWETTSQSCGAVLPNLEKLSYKCTFQDIDGNAKIHGKTVREPRGGMCKTTELKRYTKYTAEVYVIYNNKKVSQGLTVKIQTGPGVPDKVQQLKVHLIKHNVIRVTCSPPVGGFKGPKKVYIVRLIGGREVEETAECHFEIGDLSYLTSYTVQVFAFNGVFESEAETTNVSTRYNDKALSGILIFILISLIIILVALRLAAFIKKRKKSKKVTKEEVMLTSTANEDTVVLKTDSSFAVCA